MTLLRWADPLKARDWESRFIRKMYFRIPTGSCPKGFGS